MDTFVAGGSSSHFRMAPWFLLALGTVGCLGVVDPDTETPGVSERLGIGDPCVPEVEKETHFSSFHENQVTIESKSRSCASGVCLVNHFRGRVGCPYGKSAPGEACKTQDGRDVLGNENGDIDAQCTNRRPTDAVYCSCRCQNAQGRTDDGASYCSCGAGYACEGLIDPVPGEEAVAGGYCVKVGTKYDPTRGCAEFCNASDPSARCD
jgi:hypothetical protein